MTAAATQRATHGAAGDNHTQESRRAAGELMPLILGFFSVQTGVFFRTIIKIQVLFSPTVVNSCCVRSLWTL